MYRRHFLLSLAASAAASSLHAQRTSPLPRAATTPRQLRDTLVIDAMGELRMEYTDDVVRSMLASGMDAITITLCDPKPEGDEALALAVDSLLAHDRYLASRPDLYVKATTAADIDRARRAGKLAVFYLFQNTVQFGTSLDRVDMFHRLGLRSCQLTYNTRNHVGVGCWEDGGMTPFGHELIRRMNERRMLVDLSHANMQTMREAIAASRAPVIISHTACMAVHENRRNTTDDVMRALADRGGVVGICQMRPFLTSKRGKDALPAYFDHIVHAIKVAGAEHVCIGSDRDHRVITLSPEYVAELKKEEGAQVQDSELPYFIDELNGPRRMEVVWDGLVKRGLSTRDVERVMGGNVFRLYRDVMG
ncbi:MAG TPA: membrane dipeptidase [Gemmatimonadaceae bacterium]|nr:membrane dipeptidase [Gemmatimonadaceae bacterium]